MTKKWLFIDGNFICYRNFYAMGGLSHGDLRTGVLFGFMKDLLYFQEVHRTQDVVFCFDYGKCLRTAILPEYKSARKKQRAELNDEDQELRKEFLKQVDQLRTVWLPTMGFRNICFQEGYEADDIIASLCHQNLGKGDEAIIVSSDSDLYQLIRPRVSIWDANHRVLKDMVWFQKKYSIHPREWWRVRALCGCSTDCVPGVAGVGETTAIRYLQEKLPSHFKAFDAIESNKRLAKFNEKLVRLPFKDTNIFFLRPDQVTKEGWQEVCDALGIRSLRELAPTPTRTRTSHGTSGKRW